MPTLGQVGKVAGTIFDFGTRLAKLKYGAKQMREANKGLKKLVMPTYERPEEINQITDLFRQRAAATEMPGQTQFEENLGQAYGEGVYEAQKSAPSSLMAQGAAVDLAGKRMQAIQDLAGQFAEFKAKRQQELAGALQTSADYTDQEFKMNQYDPYFIKRNELTSQRNAGAQNVFGGAQETGSFLNDLQGTNQYLEILKQLQGLSGTKSGFPSAPKTLADMPVPSYSPTTSWKNYRGTLKY